MADTGSEIADGAERAAIGAIGRMLERELSMRVARHGAHAAEAAEGMPSGDVELGVRCPEGDADARAEELLEAMEARGVTARLRLGDGARPLRLAVPADQAEPALRALERLSASGRSGFSLHDAANVGALEWLAGRRAIDAGRGGREHDAATAGDVDAGIARAEPVESVALTFANHPEAPRLDERDGRAYARRMRDLGFDAAHRRIERLGRDADGSLARTPEQVVGVSYLARDRDDFLLASGVALHEIGAPLREDPFAGDHEALAEARDRLLASSQARADAFEANRRLADEVHRGARSPLAPAREASSRHEADRELTAEEYDALPPREQAKVDPARIPDAAFGRARAADVAREQAGVAAALCEHASPSRSHPSIGGR